MRVCFVGAYDRKYPRNRILQTGLEHVGIEVRIAHIPPRSKTLHRIRHLVEVFRSHHDCDVFILSAFNQLTVPVAWLLAKIYRKPLLVDYLTGLTDIAIDRRRLKLWKLWLYRLIDRFNVTMTDTVTDTEAHRKEFELLLGRQLPRMRILPVGAIESDILPVNNQTAPIIQYVGTYVPFHGTQVILRAAKQLPQYQFEFIGHGQTYDRDMNLANELGLSNVKFIRGYFSREKLRQMQERSSLMLGVFGKARKRDYVVPIKVFDALVLGRPLVTGESTAVSELFDSDEHLVTVPPDDPDSLADAIRKVLSDQKSYASLRKNGRQIIESSFLPRHIGLKLKEILKSIV